jgi:hypothetical protein
MRVFHTTRGLVIPVVVALVALFCRLILPLGCCSSARSGWATAYDSVVPDGALSGIHTAALVKLLEEKEALEQSVLSWSLALKTRTGAQALAEANWECKSSLLDLLACYLHSTTRGRRPARLAAVQELYRSLVLAWLLHHEGKALAADIALDTAAAYLGYDWQQHDAYAGMGKGASTAPGLPSCATAWSLLRFMWAAPHQQVPYMFHLEAGGLFPGWRELMARASNYSLEAEAGRLGGQMEVVSTADDRQLLLVSSRELCAYAVPCSLRGPLPPPSPLPAYRCLLLDSCPPPQPDYIVGLHRAACSPPLGAAAHTMHCPVAAT